jgi:hypothetical protein
MGVDHHSRLSKCMPQDHVRGFSPDTRQTHQRFHGVRHSTVKALDQRPAAQDDALGLSLEKPRRPDQMFQFRLVGLCIIRGSAIPPEQLTGDLVDPLVRALS